LSLILDFLFVLAFLCYIPSLTIRKKWHKGFWDRFGFLPQSLVTELSGHKKIWIHAVSVGEVLAIVDLVKRMAKEHSDCKIICSTVTKTGHKIAMDNLKDVATIIYAPLDFSWVVQKYVRLIDPRIYIATETELWPNLYQCLNENNVPIIQINGRISDKAYNGYRRIKFFTKRILKFVTYFIMQTQTDADRIEDLGASPEKIKVFGNIKFDNVPEINRSELAKLPFAKDDILLAGSTHPGEEEIILQAYQQLIKNFPELRLVITPRHVDRSPEIAKIVEAKGFKPILFSAMDGQTLNRNSVVVVDMMGQLRNLYALAKIVFIGKTFRVGGAQNMIEPASFAKAVVVGPQTYNFRDVVKIFLDEEAMLQVEEEALAGTLLDLLKDDYKRKEIEQKAALIVERYKGATTKTLEVISSLLLQSERYYSNKLKIRSLKNYLYDVVMGENKSLSATLIKIILWILSLPYAIGVRLVSALYARGILKNVKLKVPVISIGNITWGGSGKTPFVNALVKELVKEKFHPIVLTRGYMQQISKDNFSDEAKLLEENLDVPVLVGKNRAQLAQSYLQKNDNVSCFVMDDGFQHWKLARDLDTVLIDSTDPFGSEALLPAGTLREPLSALKRAHVIVFTKINLERSHMRALKSRIKSINPEALIVESIHEPVSLIDLQSGHKKDLNILIGQEVVSFCSIAAPYAFAETIKLLEAKLVHQFAFLDHHRYTSRELSLINEYAKEKNIKTLVTTEKDAVKLKTFLKVFDPQIKVYVLKMSLTITEGRDAFFERIRTLISH
jgi:3-deoxy-D-manno-octulosonic-acid transferase